jgi:hypothetical protein
LYHKSAPYNCARSASFCANFVAFSDDDDGDEDDGDADDDKDDDEDDDEDDDVAAVTLETMRTISPG